MGRGDLPSAAGQKAGWASAWWPGPAEKRPAERERGGHARHAHGAVTARNSHVRQRGGTLTSGWPVASCCQSARRGGGHREGTGQGGRGCSSPERQCGAKAVEKSQDNDVHRRGESSSGQWRWRHGPAVSMRKREGEGGLNWGERGRMEGSHCEAAGAVELEQEPKRRRGLQRREPVRQTRQQWRRGEELRLERE
jgi:hypothetical protein